MIETSEDDRYLGGMGIIGVVGGAEECTAARVAVDVTDHVPVRRQPGHAIDQSCRRRFIDIGELDGKFTARLVPQDECGGLIRQGCLQKFQYLHEITPGYEAAA